MNRFKDIATMFNTELGEKFLLYRDSGVRANNNPYMFTGSGLQNDNNMTCTSILTSLLKGEYTIEKLPWKPSTGNKFYYLRKLTAGNKEWAVNSIIFIGCTFDLMCVATGNCFKTEAEAEQNKDKIIGILGEHLL